MPSVGELVSWGEVYRLGKKISAKKINGVSRGYVRKGWKRNTYGEYVRHVTLEDANIKNN